MARANDLWLFAARYTDSLRAIRRVRCCNTPGCLNESGRAVRNWRSTRANCFPVVSDHRHTIRLGRVPQALIVPAASLDQSSLFD